MTQPKTARVSDGHYHHLDALRGAFMITGVFVHASTLGHDSVFRGIAYASGLFRMAGFYLISGFLTAMLVLKYGSRVAVRRRLTAIGAPLVCTFLLFNPPTLWMTYNFHNDPNISFFDFLRGRTLAHPEGELHWTLHLWFLIVLLVYVLCAPALVAMCSRLVGTSAFRRATQGRLRFMATVICLLVVVTIVLRGGRRAVVEPVLGTGTVGELARFTLEFLPLFALGVLLYLDRARLLPMFQRPAPVLLAVSGAALLAANRGWVPVLASGTGLVLSETVVSVAIIATMFALAARLVPGPSPAARYLADASYTVYLFHFFWIYIFASLFQLDASLRWPMMLVVSLLTIGMTLAIHHFFILRSTFLRKIFNGKFPTGPRNAATSLALSPTVEPADLPAVEPSHRKAARPAARHTGWPAVERTATAESTLPLAVAAAPIRAPAGGIDTQPLHWTHPHTPPATTR